MEREPEHEYEPITSECGNEQCGETFEIAPENSRIDAWTLMPDCDYLFTYCPHCEEYFLKLFLKDADKEGYLKMGFERIVSGDYPPKHIIASFTEVYGQEPFDPRNHKENALTPRQNNVVAYLGYLLLNGHITVEEFINGTGELSI